MHFISEYRYNPKTCCDEKYYRIKETFRDQMGKVHSRILLNVGYLSGLRPEDIRDIGHGLDYMYRHQGESEMYGKSYSHYNEAVRSHIDEYWSAMIEQGSIDGVRKIMDDSKLKARSYVDSETMKHTEVRELGSEWLCMQALEQLDFEAFLRNKGWSEAKIKAAISLLVTRTIYTPSELKSTRIMEDNSGVCELVYGSQDIRPGYKMVYKVAPELYKIKAKLERHLCSVTDTLFNRQNRIVLFDLTNFYFESRKDNSRKAKFGRSKEKRNDCKLLVLALCINTDGFIRYSSILEGNTADPKSLPHMIENLIAENPLESDHDEKILVVIDAGIATEENLELIKSKGYNYLCVSRRRLTDYELNGDGRTVVVHDCKEREIRLSEIRHDDGGDYYLRVDSPMKALKESSMNRQFRERFETELQKAKDSLGKRGSTKKYEKVIERVGRAMQKYPSIAKFYKVGYAPDRNDPGLMGDITWEMKVPDLMDRDDGIYFLRTNVMTLDQKTTWDYYNLIRDIECTNRQLKTDLSLRPIYHQKDENSDAHLFFGLLAYWIVNTIRHQLQQNGVKNYWTEIVRMMSPQKIVTTEAVNALGEKMKYRICSEPGKDAAEIYKILHYKDRPFRKKKICSTQ